MFNLIAPFKPAGDQPQAIAKLTDGILSGAKHQVVLGVTDISPGMWRVALQMNPPLPPTL